MSKRFSFIFPITEPVADKNRREGLSFKHTGDWRINGEASQIKISSFHTHPVFEFEIEEILYDGTDVNAVLTTTQIVDDVKAACLNHIQNIFDDEPEDKKADPVRMGNPLAKIIHMPLVLHRKVK